MARNRKKIVYDSKFEQAIWDDAKARGIDGIIYHPRSFKWASKVRAGECGECGSKQVVKGRVYTPDFKLGSGEVYLEAKGKFTPSNRTDMAQFVAQYRERGVEIRFLFMRDNWLTGKHLSRYSDWAEALGVKWAVGARLPQLWVDELGL